MDGVQHDEQRAGTVRMWDTMKNRRVGPAEVREQWGVGPELLGKRYDGRKLGALALVHRLGARALHE